MAVLKERTDARDCEAMASGRDAAGRPMLWIGDIGDNRAVRTSVVLRLVREPDPVRPAKVTPVSLRVRYPGGPSDAESLLWTTDGRLLIVTKGVLGGDVLRSRLRGPARRSPATPSRPRSWPVSRLGQPDLPDRRRRAAGRPAGDPRLPGGHRLRAAGVRREAARGPDPAGRSRCRTRGRRWRRSRTAAHWCSGRRARTQPLVRVAVPGAAPSGSTGAPGSASSTGATSDQYDGGGGPGLDRTWLGRGLIALAVLTVAGVGLHLLRGRRATAARR